MGAVCSSISELSNNEPLRRLSGTEPIDPMDPFWNQLLSFSFLTPMNSADSRLLEEATLIICKSFAINNCKTGNFNSLIRTFLVRSTELKASAQLEDNIFTWQTYNALFIIRCVCKYFVEHLSEELLLQQFDVKAHQPTDKTGSTPSEQHTGTSEELITSLVELLVDVPVVSCTYALHVEALNTLIVLLSIQMFQPQPAVRFSVYRFMMEGKCSIHACVFMKALLRNFIEQQKCPAELFKSSEESGLYRVTAAVASGLWSVLTLGFGGKQKKSEDEINDAILANQSLLFILILANHCTNEKGLHNPYREALFSFTNSQDQSNTLPTQAVATFKIDFSKLYTTICSMLKDDQTTLLLYLLVHRNSHMKAFILSRTNTDQLVLPILKILYHAPDRNSHHIYMALIILLVLSEDEFFSKSVHEITLQTIPWFKERVISEITLGGLLILVVIRTIQYNMTRMRDKYLHTNCLAALANMSAHFRNLHPYVAQRIVSLFAQLCKKHTRLIEQIRLSAVQDVTKNPEIQDSEDSIQELAVLEEVIRMVLEIINSCLSSSLHHNPNLLYTLLYQKDLFTPFRSHPTFQDILQNIDTVLTYFSSKLEQNGHQLSPGEVLEVITQGAVQFRRDRLKKFPELKFKYVEEDSPEEFFIPYIWSLVYHASTMYFNPSRIVLFSLGSHE